MTDVNTVYYRGARTPALHVLQLYDAGRVQRFHTTPDYSGAPRQSLAEHQWGVAMFCRELCRRHAMSCSAELLVAALTHDLSEYWTCDMPAHVKWVHPALTEALNNAQTHEEVARGIRSVERLTKEEIRILKFADSIELYVYSRQRARAGVQAYDVVAANIYNHVLSWTDQHDALDWEGLTLLMQLKAELSDGRE